MTMTFADFIRNMGEDELDNYAKNCSTSVGYIKIHLLHARKTPKKKLMAALVENSAGKITTDDVLSHFYGKKEQVA